MCRTAYDLNLHTKSDSAEQPLLEFIAQTNLYSKQATEMIVQSYVNLVEALLRS